MNKVFQKRRLTLLVLQKFNSRANRNKRTYQALFIRKEGDS
ncbi:hypothetical protein PLUTE_a4011 [Pseudoalteromonas luteoviolacea DSM 6061]|nr:hypothetical protein [Pseudoalteromonas luteoviolacea DSM 6061]